MIILGAGYAGLLAACVFQNAEVYEKGTEHQRLHQALMRFRSPAVGKLVGVDFEEVLVHKGIWYQGKFVEPNIQLANYYAQKVSPQLTDRSIWDIEPRRRWIAPKDFMGILQDRVGKRVMYGVDATQMTITAAKMVKETIINTIPMPSIIALVKDFHEIHECKYAELTKDYFAYPLFYRKEIGVRRWTIPGINLHQTIYYPDPVNPMYRASIVGDELIMEYITNVETSHKAFSDYIDDTLVSFGFKSDQSGLVFNSSARQEFGKISPIPDNVRKSIMLALNKLGMFSLGRFATWRNILLDDVINDIDVIKKLINLGDYDRQIKTLR